MRVEFAGGVSLKIDPGKEPKQIDITLHLKKGDRTVLGIYEIKGDTLKVCYFGSDTGQQLQCWRCLYHTEAV